MRARRLNSFAAFAIAAVAAVSTQAAAQPSASDAVLRVVDIGPGLCVVIAVPGGHAMLYDAGPPGATRCVDAARELVPGRRFDLVVLSHSDNDHISMIPALLGDGPGHRPGAFSAAVIIHPGDPHLPTSPRGAVARARAAIEDQRQRGACVYNLLAIEQLPPPAPGTAEPPPVGPPPCKQGRPHIGAGDSFPVGAGSATFVAGWGDGNLARQHGEPRLTGGPLNNALSIVIRFTYGGHSVLLTGDTVGRMLVDPPNTCAYAERIMADNFATVRVASDVLVGQHHGANNSTSECLVDAVRPEFVIFSAGHAFHHPTQAAVARLTDPRRTRPVALANIFRTDLGDNEGANEMAGAGGCADRTGDDDVEVRLPRSASGRVTVAYRNASAGCGP